LPAGVFASPRARSRCRRTVRREHVRLKLQVNDCDENENDDSEAKRGRWWEATLRYDLLRYYSY